jgi:hypothetical protein
MGKNGKIYFDVNFDKQIIKKYIKANLKQDELTDENLELMFKSIISSIVEESLPNLKDLYINKDYKFIQIRIIGHKEEPKNNMIDIEIDEENSETVNITAKVNQQ